MSALRRDPIVGRWVINLEDGREISFVPDELRKVGPDFCPFCEGNEGSTRPEVFAIRGPGTAKDTPGWLVRVVPSISPFLRVEGELNKRGDGMFDMMNNVGAHEVIIETPHHVYNLDELDQLQVERVITAYLERITDLKKDKRFRYVLIFKNHGERAGSATIKHCHSQLIAISITPKSVKEELMGAKEYFAYKERCVYCDVIHQELASRERIIIESDHFIAICPFASRFPFEIWILPRVHRCDFEKISPEEIPSLAAAMRESLQRLNKVLNYPSYNYFLQTGPNRYPRRGYWKTLERDFHWHLEITPRLELTAGFEWGTGFHINTVRPEQAAHRLREVKI